MLSVIDQDYVNLEFIVIDGGSEDGSVDIIKKHSRSVSYWVSEKDNGQSDAINKGLKTCTGDIITWLCSDDVYLPGTLHKFAELYNEFPDAGLIHGKSILFGRDRKAVVSGAEKSDLELRYFACIPFPQPGSFFTRKAVRKCGLLDDSLHYAMDYDLVMRIALRMPIVRTEHVFSRYRLHPESKSMGQLERFSGEWTRVFSRFMNSVNLPSNQRKLLVDNGFLLEDEPPYSHERQFTETDLTRIICHFLFNQLIVFYEQTRKDEGLNIIKLIKEIDPGYHSGMKLNRLDLRLRYLPGPIIRLARKITR